MILFKRVGESFKHIEDREWLLLFLETLGVVAGILIAFELNEWGAQRAAAQRQHELLERLFEESEATVAVLRSDRDQMVRISDGERSFATMLIQKNNCPPQSMWQAVDTLPMYPAVTVPSTVYQEIMGSGGLSSIRDIRVRQSVSYYRATLELTQAQNANFRAHVTLPVPTSDGRVTYDFDAAADEPQVARYDTQALCSDHVFRNSIVESVRDHWFIANLRGELADSAIEMCATIGASLERKCVPLFGGPLAGADARLAAKVASRGKRADPKQRLELPSPSASPSAPGAGRARG